MFILVKNFPSEVEHSTQRYTKIFFFIFCSRIFNIASEVKKNCCRFYLILQHLKVQLSNKFNPCLQNRKAMALQLTKEKKETRVKGKLKIKPVTLTKLKNGLCLHFDVRDPLA